MMPKKAGINEPAKQSARFAAEAQGMIDAGELSPIDAESALDTIVRKDATPKRQR